VLGQFYSENGSKYNTVILAGGLGTRMGSASEHIPKALSKLGNERAIDLLLNKFMLVSGRTVIGTGWHGDLLESYVRGRFTGPTHFSREDPSALAGNGLSLLYALDSCDSRLGTIVSFCDLLMVSNPKIGGNTLYAAHRGTTGVVGTFRHSIERDGARVSSIVCHKSPQKIGDVANGVIGFFVFENTILLKEIVYGLARRRELKDITTDVITRYLAAETMQVYDVEALIEFGNEQDLEAARRVWENY